MAFLPLIAGLISAVAPLIGAFGSKPSAPPAPTVPEPPPPPPVENNIEPEGIIDEQLNRTRELARQASSQSDQFLRLQQEPADASSLTKLTAKSGD